MTRRLLLVACLALAAAYPARAEIRFAIPDGWTDLSPGKTAPASVPEGVVTIAQSGMYTLYAMDLEGAKDDGFAENMNAIVRAQPLVADDRTLQQLVSSLPEEAMREVPGAKVGILEQSVVPVAGVPSLRVVVELTSGRTTMRSLEYVIPCGDSTAQLTYSSTPQEFAKYLPIFEASVQKTQGAAAAPFLAQMGSKIMGGTGLSGGDLTKILSSGGALMGAGIAVLLVSWLGRRGKRKNSIAG
jgi:hypothetical protein